MHGVSQSNPMEKTPKIEEMVTESDLMQSWKVSKSHVRSFLSTIPHYKIGRCRRYKASDVNQFLEQHKQKTSI
jgi:hypothetical protein